jgi:hypothetical protein
VNGKSGKCVGVDRGSTASGAAIELDTCDDAYAPHSQVWELERDDSDGKLRLVNSYSHMCIGIDDSSTANGKGLYQYPCSTTRADEGWDFVE